jgi:hypothetical protein
LTFARAEELRRQNMGPLEARMEKLERALAYQDAEIAKQKGVQQGNYRRCPTGNARKCRSSWGCLTAWDGMPT